MPTSTRNSKSRSSSSAKNPVVIVETEPDLNPTMALGDVYPDESDPEPKINPALLTGNSAVFQRFSASLKTAPPQSQVSIQEILSSKCYQPPKLIEYILEDFDKYGIDVNDSNILFTSYVNSTNQLTVGWILPIQSSFLQKTSLFIQNKRMYVIINYKYKLQIANYLN